MSRVDRCEIFDLATPKSKPKVSNHAVFDHVFGDDSPRKAELSEVSTSAGEDSDTSPQQQKLRRSKTEPLQAVPPQLERSETAPACAQLAEVRVVGHESREDHTTYTIEVRRPGQETIVTRRRYKEFDAFRQDVVKAAPATTSFPRFPLRRRETMSTFVGYVSGTAQRWRSGSDEEEHFGERAKGLDAWLCAVVAQDPQLRSVDLCCFLNVPACRIEDSSRPNSDEGRVYHLAFHCQGHKKMVPRKYQAFKQLKTAAEKAGFKDLPAFPGVMSKPKERQQLLQTWLQAVFDKSSEQGWRFGALRRFLELED